MKPSLFRERFELNRRYVASLTAENLLHSHYMEAGLWQPTAKPHDFEHIHMGWEAPTSQVRGMFVGHWLSAAARIWATTGDPEL
ncbi:MAG TPA: beta-L-arabinofuranosidase domain-containing protein, partial [Phototrophicaceae bacterium]|nr:beta-L-arabinofuranosidase domain-containing protein [Phototrophicaceae bacterium]